ncbi:MAG: hypothetical protein H0W74_14255 [Sphingosinicella sp.]|nr:hypothetical protein [Sphingosinicella sp.]
MKQLFTFTIVASLLASAQPCAAAQELDPTQSAGDRVSAFVGFQARMVLGQRKIKPAARFMVGTMRTGRNPGHLSHSAPKFAGLEWRFTKTAQPSLFLGGQSLMETKARLGVGNSKVSAWLVAGGVAIAAAAVLLLSLDLDNKTCIPEDLDCET